MSDAGAASVEFRAPRVAELQPLAGQQRSARPRQVEWSRSYHNCCLIVALLVATSPLLGLALYAGWRALSGTVGKVQDAACDSGLRTVDSLSINTSRSSTLALATYTDDGPRVEYRRIARLSLNNKRAYAAMHDYTLYVFTASRPECVRRGSTSMKLLALEQLVRRREHEWLFWLDPDVMIVDQTLPLPTALGAALQAGGGGRAANVQMVVSAGGERELSLAALAVGGRSEWSMCLLGHAIAMRSCPPRGASSLSSTAEVPALLALLRPREVRELECILEFLPSGCSNVQPAASASSAGDARVVVRARSQSAAGGSSLPIGRKYTDGVAILPRQARVRAALLAHGADESRSSDRQPRLTASSPPCRRFWTSTPQAIVRAISRCTSSVASWVTGVARCDGARPPDPPGSRLGTPTGSSNRAFLATHVQ